MNTHEPPGVRSARERAQSSGFALSSDNGVGARVVRELAPADLIFADAVGGKTEGLEATIDALRAGGILVVDDMDSRLHGHDGLLDAINRVRNTLVDHPQLVTTELDFSTGVVVATKRGPA